MATTYIPSKKVAVTISYDAVYSYIEKKSRRALDEALPMMEARAKHYAPVRDVFKHHGWAKPRARVPRGVMRTRSGEIVGRRIRHHTERGRARFMKLFRAQSFKNRESWVPTFDGERKTGTRRVRGNPRSFEPVFRLANGGMTTGEYRNVRLNTVTGVVSMDDIEAFDTGAKKPRIRSGEEFLSARGKAELRRANEFFAKVPKKDRARTVQRVSEMSVTERQRRYEKYNVPEKKRRPPTALYVDAGGQMTLGGRLRGEIYRTEVMTDGGHIYGEVVSPTEYAKYQEYGTSNHRAQPFMRPALYDMRVKFPQMVRSALRQGR